MTKKKKKRSGKRKRAVSRCIRYRFIKNFGYICFRCLKTDFKFDQLTMDHITPVFLGGKTELKNLQLLCMPCNNYKACQIIDYRYNVKPLASADLEFLKLIEIR